MASLTELMMYSSIYTAQSGNMYRKTSGRISASFSPVVKYVALPIGTGGSIGRSSGTSTSGPLAKA
jgi:hypothetical protein